MEGLVVAVRKTEMGLKERGCGVDPSGSGQESGRILEKHSDV
jgi:hypothetical protein